LLAAWVKPPSGVSYRFHEQKALRSLFGTVLGQKG
jgi:hypothetical protein